MKVPVGSRIPTAVALVFACTLLFPLPSHPQVYKVIYAFTGKADGGQPTAGVVFDKAGNLYGTTSQGGESGCFGGTCGVAFELSPGSGGWSGSTLQTFSGGSDGGNPTDSPNFDLAGNMYLTAQVGGISCGATFGCGVASELSPHVGGWTAAVLYSFQGGTDGYYPIASLIPDKQGNLYSTLSNGGSTQGGQVYELAQDAGVWKKDILHDFSAGGAGSEPTAAPIFDAAGNLYGTTSGGSYGAVWELLHGSWKEKTLYEFTAGAGGGHPFAGLVFDKAGNLYGTTRAFGKYNAGIVFKLTPGAKGKWKETVPHAFKGGSDGNQPFSTPVFDKTGNLYGTTYSGGDLSCNPPYGCGTVFKLTPGKNGRWKETVLHRFTGPNDGLFPYYVKLAIDPAGNLYGTTFGGGNPGCYLNLGCGVVFEITH